MLAEEPVFQVNLCLSNEIIWRESVPVHDRDCEGVIKRQRGWKLKHFAKYWIKVARNVVISVTDGLLPNCDFYVRVRFSVWISRMKLNTLCIINTCVQNNFESTILCNDRFAHQQIGMAVSLQQHIILFQGLQQSIEFDDQDLWLKSSTLQNYCIMSNNCRLVQ